MGAHRRLAACTIPLVLLIWCAVASGQGLLGRLVSPEPTPDAPSIEVTTPLAAIASGGRSPELTLGGPVPIDVVIGPGDFSGVVVLTHSQDGTQDARVLALAAGHPDGPTRVPMVMELGITALGSAMQFSVEIHGRDSEGEPVYRREEYQIGSAYARVPSAGRRDAPFTVGMSGRVIGVIGQVAVPGSIQVGRSMRCVAIEPHDAPEVWRAYQAMDAMLVDERELDRYSADAVGAIALWLHAGGRMVLLADEHGSGRERLALALGQDPGLWRGITTTGAGGASGDVGGGLGFLPLPHDFGIAWAAARPGVTGVGAALVGFGSVLVIEGDPDFMSISNQQSNAEYVFDLDNSQADRNLSWSGYQTRRQSMTMGWLADSVLDAELDFDGGVLGMMYAICAMILLLALLMGPVDRFVLKRKGWGAFSWLTAICWIGVASLAAMLAPLHLRSGDSSMTRVETIDLISDAEGSIGWRLGTTGLFAGDEIAYTPRSYPGAWWRGVQASSGDLSGEFFQPLTLAQGRGLSSGGTEPMGGEGDHASTQAQWTFRMFEDRSRVRLPLRSELRIDASGRETVRLSGLPEGAQVRGATLHRRGQRAVGIEFVSSGGGLTADIARAGEIEVELRERISRASTQLDATMRTPAVGWMLQSQRYAMLTLDVEGWPAERPDGFDGEIRSAAVVRLMIPIVEEQPGPAAPDGGESGR